MPVTVQIGLKKEKKANMREAYEYASDFVDIPAYMMAGTLKAKVMAINNNGLTVKFIEE